MALSVYLSSYPKRHVYRLSRFSEAYGCDQQTDTYTHTHPFNGPFSGLPGWADTRKVKPIWILLKQETVSGSGISWAICMSAPCSRMTTTQAPQHSVFTGRMPFLSPNQQRQSTEGNNRQTDRWTKKHRPYYTCSSRPHLTLFTGSRRKKRFYAHVSVSSYSDGVFVYFIMILLWCGTVNCFCFWYCLHCSKDIELLTDEITLPPDRPLCGFHNELCPHDHTGNCIVQVCLHFILLRYDTRCYFDVRSKAEISQLNLPRGSKN